MSRVALIIIFNHKYDRNIQALRNLYAGRFKNVWFLVPFYTGADVDVIPVYENSYYFEGYIAQGLRQYFDESVQHYIFVADDMILNPKIDESNCAEYFGIGEDESFIPEIFSLHDFHNDDTLLTEHLWTAKPGKVKRHWWRNSLVYDYSPAKMGVEVDRDLPNYQEAEERLRRHGFTIEPLRYSDIFGGIDRSASLRGQFKRLVKMVLDAPSLWKQYHLRYPLVASYSDLVVVDRSAIRDFAQYCGAFAATELFVEVAIPTALLLAAGKIKTEPAIGRRGILYWNYRDEQLAQYAQAMQAYGFQLHELIARFPADKLYIHPIKLSQWKTDLPQETQS